MFMEWSVFASLVICLECSVYIGSFFVRGLLDLGNTISGFGKYISRELLHRLGPVMLIIHGARELKLGSFFVYVAIIRLQIW